jgi:pimeloyl-ACP methyl ester carboxylesterase
VSDRAFDPRRAALLLAALLGLLASLGVAPARAAWPLRVCGDHGELQCGRVSVPLDPSGRVPGRVSLYVKRFSEVPHPSGTVVALAGGPGQSSIGVLPLFISTLQPILGDRALVVFDGRGIGRSGRLDCKVPKSAPPSADLISVCARQLKPADAFYATTNTVSDLEHLRRSLEIGHFTLYGVSYGTLGAVDYARAHPQRVDHLILDSVVPPGADPALKLSTFVAMRRVLAGLCAAGCPGLAPIGDLSALTQRPDVGRFVNLTVAEAIVDGDFDPLLRSDIPALLHLAAAGDDNARFRLADLEIAVGYLTSAAGRREGTGGPTTTFGFEPEATRCEDERFPWREGDPLRVRAAKLDRALSRVPESAIAPFTHLALRVFSAVDGCAHWPRAGNAPATESAPLPSTPTLILSGQNDVRTPTADAAALASELPRASLLVVPNTGHAVLANDVSGCATHALATFITGAPVRTCPAAAPPPVDPLPPSLTALAPTPPLTGEPGRVLTAAVLTLRHDVGLTQFYAAYTVLGVVSGTTDGVLIAARRRHVWHVTLADLSYIRGVKLDGALTVGPHYDTGTVRVSDAGRRYGTLTLHPDGSISGALGGRPVGLSRSDRNAIVAANGLAGETALFDPLKPTLDPRA